MTQSHDLQSLGLARIGGYRDGQFGVDPAWKTRKGVYVWAHSADGMPVPRRVGIACGASGIGGRHMLHNRWLAGLFKPDDIREQAVRRFTLEGLGPSAELWAAEIPEREKASAFERAFRAMFEPHLHVDLSLKSSWIKKRMTEWHEGARRR